MIFPAAFESGWAADPASRLISTAGCSPLFAATAGTVETLHAWRQLPTPAARSEKGGDADEG